MKLWKRNAVVAAIVLFVCVAVYLNWSYSQDGVAAGGPLSAAGKTLGEAALVNSGVSAGGQSAEDGNTAALAAQDAQQGTEGAAQPEDGAAPEGGSSNSGYFSNARLTRQQARDNAISILQSTVDDEAAEQAIRDQAAESITTMASATVAEAQIENLVTAKGYSDCVAFIGEDGISVVVSAQEGGLTDTDVARITDIVLGETEFTVGQITIIEAD
ncbi:MAG: SpoIIIAH-like family protein [Oscillospiraceae bacterium]|nr:SpoIIIAH-like family protein [Oscillospiraceae bacterium]